MLDIVSKIYKNLHSNLPYLVNGLVVCRRFRPGLDYTVAHYGILTTNAVLDATLCYCGSNGEQCTFDEKTGDLIGSDDDTM